MNELQKSKCDTEVKAQLLLNRAKKLKLLTRKGVKYFQDGINLFGKKNLDEIMRNNKQSKEDKS